MPPQARSLLGCRGREMMACSSAESHAQCVGGQSSWAGQPQFRMTSASNCQTGKGPTKGINLSCHHYRCYCNHHHLPPPPPPYRTFTTITPPPPTDPVDVRASPPCTSHYHDYMQHMTLICQPTCPGAYLHAEACNVVYMTLSLSLSLSLTVLVTLHCSRPHWHQLHWRGPSCPYLTRRRG